MTTDPVASATKALLDAIERLANARAQAAFTALTQGKATAATRVERRPPPPASNGARKKKWTKRPSAELAHLAEQMAAYVAKNPGQKMETIASALRVKPRDLTRPAQNLRRAGRLFSTGKVQTTEYYPQELR
jgi:hypothetical protein